MNAVLMPEAEMLSALALPDEAVLPSSLPVSSKKANAMVAISMTAQITIRIMACLRSLLMVTSP